MLDTFSAFVFVFSPPPFSVSVPVSPVSWSLSPALLPLSQIASIRFDRRFVRFANMLINDSIYHMDEAVKFLSAIKVAQVHTWPPFVPCTQ